MRIWVIEDQERWQEMIRRHLIEEFGEHLVIVQSWSLEEAETELATERTVDLIAIDACLWDKRVVNVLPFLKKIREKYDCPIIAISSIKKFNQTLKKNGCDFSCEKWHLANLAREILGG